MSFEKQSQDYFNKKNISAFIKEAISMEQTGRTGFHYLYKKRAANLLKQSGYQLPSLLVINNSNVIIRKIYENVNRKIDTVLKSKQFLKWFGDWQNSPETASKVVNEDGTPEEIRIYRLKRCLITLPI